MSYIVYGILGIIVLAVLFLVGIILIIRGFMKKYLAEYANSKKPKAMMITGTVFVSLPVVVFVALSLWSITSSVTTVYNRTHYESVPDIWRHESVDRSKAESDIMTALLTSADKDNREAFAKNFTPEIQQRSGFDAAVDQFFECYPYGISHCDSREKELSWNEGKDTGTKVLTDSLRFRCNFLDEWYFIIVNYCYANPRNPDKVGVTNFRIMNLEAAAVYDANPGAYENDYLVCERKSSSEVNARLIGGRPYVWDDSGRKAVVSEDKIRFLLRNGGRLDDSMITISLGDPGVAIKNDYSKEYGYIYQLADDGPEPVYIYFQTDSEWGNIIYSYICTPEKVDFDKPVVGNKTGS